MTMTDSGGVQKNTAYGVFVQACWAQHKRQYPDELIHKEIEEFNKQCSVWWYNLSEGERDRFQEMADRSNAQQAALNQYQVNNVVANNTATVLQTAAAAGNNAANEIPSFGSSFAYSDYGIQQGGGQSQVVNAVVDNNGQVINYSTNPGQVGVVRQVQGGAPVGIKPVIGQKVNQKPMKDPNAPKKPLSAYFLFSQEERLKVKNENPDLSITEVAKELGKRWATLEPSIKQSYEHRYQDSRKLYDAEMSQYKPQKKKKDPNAPKQPLSAYFIFSTEERLKVKEGNPAYSICDVAKELGRRWADMDPAVKQRYQARAEEERQKYDVDMAAYRQGTFNNADNRPSSSPSHPSPSPSPSYSQGQASSIQQQQGQDSSQQQLQQQQNNIQTIQQQAQTQSLTTTADYSNLLQ